MKTDIIAAFASIEETNNNLEKFQRAVRDAAVGGKLKFDVPKEGEEQATPANKAKEVRKMI